MTIHRTFLIYCSWTCFCCLFLLLLFICVPKIKKKKKTKKDYRVIEVFIYLLHTCSPWPLVWRIFFCTQFLQHPSMSCKKRIKVLLISMAFFHVFPLPLFWWWQTASSDTLLFLRICFWVLYRQQTWIDILAHIAVTYFQPLYVFTTFNKTGLLNPTKWRLSITKAIKKMYGVSYSGYLMCIFTWLFTSFFFSPSWM